MQEQPHDIMARDLSRQNTGPARDLNLLSYFLPWLAFAGKVYILTQPFSQEESCEVLGLLSVRAAFL